MVFLTSNCVKYCMKSNIKTFCLRLLVSVSKKHIILQNHEPFFCAFFQLASLVSPLWCEVNYCVCPEIGFGVHCSSCGWESPTAGTRDALFLLISCGIFLKVIWPHELMSNSGLGRGVVLGFFVVVLLFLFWLLLSGFVEMSPYYIAIDGLILTG